MFDLNTIINAALNAAVQQAIAPLLERIDNLDAICQTQHEGMVAMRDRIAALETKLTEAALFTQTSNVTITIDEARMVEALNSQEWFWEKLQNRIDAATEQAVDNHCSTYDHDNYDEIASRVDDLPALDDYVTRDKVRSEIEDVLNNATISLSV